MRIGGCPNITAHDNAALPCPVGGRPPTRKERPSCPRSATTSPATSTPVGLQNRLNGAEGDLIEFYGDVNPSAGRQVLTTLREATGSLAELINHVQTDVEQAEHRDNRDQKPPRPPHMLTRPQQTREPSDSRANTATRSGPTLH